tara:strand:+ start:232 stop:591 length:360 start_codon:yes stop_codon:yes gene_type:complete
VTALLVDTSVWVDHLRRESAALVQGLTSGVVVTHPFVLGELSLGHLKPRSPVIGWLGDLLSAPMAEHDEVMALAGRQKLRGSGIGWVDAHLIASCLLFEARLWTLDSKLERVARRIGVG